MANVRETMVQYPGEGMALTDYAAAPATKDARPAIIVIQEWWGLNCLIKVIAKRFAGEGYVAIAPDLYSRLDHARTTDSPKADALMNRLEPGIKTAVPFHGQEPKPDAPVKNLGCPILYIYGEADGWITKADVQRLAAACCTNIGSWGR